MYFYAGVAQLVEHNVANVVVVGSKPITRSKLCYAKFDPEPRSFGVKDLCVAEAEAKGLN